MIPGFDPSKMDPKVLMELSQLVRELPHDQIMKMQSLMHNTMAGFDVRKEMEEFEKTLPAGFREKLMTLMAGQPLTTPLQTEKTVEAPPVENLTVHEARMTILKAVAEGKMSPEDAEKLLFR